MRTIDQSRFPQGDSAGFIETKEYRRFVEFAQACQHYRYIGLCYGEPGVGKSWAAAHYANWQDSILTENLVDPITPLMTALIEGCRSVLYVAPVTNTPKIMNEALRKRLEAFGIAYLKAKGETDLLTMIREGHKHCHPVIIDEADRLAFNSLEQVRHLYDERQFGLILIGMPGMERRLSRYPQLFSRIGFSHQFQKLSSEEMRLILKQRWQDMDLEYNSERLGDAEAMNAMIRLTAGNFRLLERLFNQVERIRQVNGLASISREVVDAARACLVIGNTN